MPTDQVVAQGHELELLVQEVMGLGAGVRPQPRAARQTALGQPDSDVDLAEPIFRCMLPDTNWQSFPTLYRRLRGQGYCFDVTRVPGGDQELRIWPRHGGRCHPAVAA